MGDRLGPRQIRDRPAQLEHPVIRPVRQLQLAHGRFHQRLAGIIQGTELANLGRVHVGIAGNIRPRQPLALTLAGCLHPCPHLG